MKWEEKALGDFCKLVNGKTFKAADWSDIGLPIIRIQNLNDETKPFNHWAGGLDRQVHVQRGDLLIAWSGTPGTSFGAHIWSGPEGVLNQHIFRVDIVNGEITKDWLKFCVNKQLLLLIDQAHGGVGLKHVTKGAVESIKIPLPPLTEQKRIAAILDAADALRAKRREALDQLDSLLQSTFIDMFGDPVTNPMGWEVVELSEAVQSDTVVTYGIVQAGPEYPGGVPYIRTGDIVDGIVDIDCLRHTAPDIASKFERSRVRAGEIVMSIRATVGTTAMIPKEIDGANLTQGTARISPSEHVIGLYLLHFIRTFGCQTWIQRQVKGATFREITLTRLRQMPVLVPPLDLQQRFARIVESVEQQKGAHRKHLEELDTLFAALQQHAFSGELTAADAPAEPAGAETATSKTASPKKSKPRKSKRSKKNAPETQEPVA